MKISDYYTKYLAKGKPFRHLTQHLLSGIVGFVVCYLIAGEVSVLSVVLMFLFTMLLIDLDGIITLNIFRRRYSEIRGQIGEAYKKAGIPGALGAGLARHKEINTLLVHNGFGFVGVICGFIWLTIEGRFGISFYILGGILAHFLFDILDDVYQLGHIRNWLWPLLPRRATRRAE